MKSEWKKVELRDIAKITSGNTPSKENENFWNGEFPWISAKDMKTKYLSDSMLKLSKSGFDVANKAPVNSLVVLTRGMTLHNDIPICLVKKQLAFNQDVKCIVPNENINSEYLYYYLQNNKNDLLKLVDSAGNGTGRLDSEILKAVEIYLPHIEEQKNISETLSVWDYAIEKTERLISKKEKLFNGISQIIFRKSGRKHIISEYLSIRNEKCIPDDTIPLYSLTIEDGVTPKSDRYDREVLVKDTDEKEYKVVYPGDIVFNPANLRWGAIARSNETRKVAVSPIYEVLSLDNSKINSDYLTFLLTSKDKIQYYSTKTEGTLVERMAVKVDVFLNFEIEIEEDGEKQKASAEVLTSLKKEISLLRKQLEQYKLQKQGLMQKLLTGEWRVKQSEHSYRH